MKTKKKTILFKVWKFPILSETFIVAQIVTALKCGFEVKILVEELMDLKQSTHEDLIENYSLQNKLLFEDYKIPTSKFLRYLKAFYLIGLNLPNISKLIKFIKAHKKFEIRNIYQFHFFSRLRHFDIVHVQYGTNARPLDILKKVDFFPPTLVVSFHGHDLFFPINGVIENNGYYNVLFEQADLLVANTPYLKELLCELGAPEDKIKVIPVSVDTKFFRPSEKNHSKKTYFELITVGRLEIFKGQKLGIDCIKLLREKGYDVHYTLVGTGSQEEALKEYVRKHDLDEFVTFTGRKSQKFIRDNLQDKDLFLMTSITDPEYGVETQGLVTAEAQACGLPVIGFDSGGVKYTIDEGVTGYIVPEADVNKMVERIEFLIITPELRKKMSKSAIRFIEKDYSEDSIFLKWKKNYG